MNPQFFGNLVASSIFYKLPKDTQWYILSTMSRPGETISTGGAIACKGAAPIVMSRKALAAMPMAPRSPRPKPTPVRDVPKPTKDKKKKPMLVYKSRRKHATI